MTTRTTARTFFEFLDFPLRGRTRILLALLALPLILSFFLPLWRISMVAPQYPQGLYLDIYSHRLEAGNDGHDLTEINILNHYIGMQSITEDELRDLDWLPFALGAIALLVIRVAVVGNIRSLVDLSVIAGYISSFAFGRFIYMLYSFGHHLDPKAPMQVEPFTPVIVGSKQVANFMTHSYPRSGSVCMALAIGGIGFLTFLALVNGRRRARAEEAGRVLPHVS